jgi:hypothetical protein
MHGQFGRSEGKIATEPGVQQRRYRWQAGWRPADSLTIAFVIANPNPEACTGTHVPYETSGVRYDYG